MSSITKERYQCEGCHQSIRADDYCRCAVGRDKEIKDSKADIAKVREREAMEKTERAQERQEWLAERAAWAASPEGIAEAQEWEQKQTREAATREAAREDKEAKAALESKRIDDGLAVLRRQAAKEQADAAQDAQLADRERAVKSRELSRRERRQNDGGAAQETADTPDPFDWGIRNLADLDSEPAPIHAVQGLLIQGALTMLYSPPKTGKTRLLFAMLKALSANGPDFLGQQLPDIPTLIFTEETPSLLGEHVRRNQIPAEAGHHVNTLTKMFGPADFCEEIYRTYTEAGGGFGIIAVDTLGAFCRFNDINDYGQVAQIMAPFRELARQLPNTAFLLSHHQNKVGGDSWDSALGSTALTSNVDQIIRLRRHKGKTTLAIGGRHNPEPLPFDKPIVIDIGAEGVKLLGNASDDAADMILDNMPAGAMLTVRAIRESMGDEVPSEGSFNRALKDLVKEGYVDKVSEPSGKKGAVYQVPE